MAHGSEPGGLSWVQLVAGAGAAVSTAFLLSTLGVSGTIVGAAVGSVAASIATHAYSRGLSVSAEQARAIRRIGEARADLDRVAGDADGDPEAGLEHADVALGRAAASLLRKPRLAWRHVALVAGGLFIAVMVAITGFELLTGKAVSVHTGGTDSDTPTTVLGGDSDKDEPQEKNTPTPGVTPSTTPTETATETPTVPTTETPGETATPTDTPTEAEPTATPSPSEPPVEPEPTP